MVSTYPDCIPRSMLMFAERHNPQQQDDFRAQAHELLQDVLTKNNEADERKVGLEICLDVIKADQT